MVEKARRRTGGSRGSSEEAGIHRMEMVRDFRGGRLKVALFDFDGTLSLIRQGWQEVMVSLMVGLLEATGTRESRTELRGLVKDFVARLTGKQTIYQMLRLVEELRARGARPAPALHYKQLYHERLEERIRSRIEALRSGGAPPQEWLVTGSLDVLRNLHRRGIVMYLASGTDESFVREEAELLGVTPFFEQRVFGALDDHRKFSKRLLIERIFSEHGLAEGEFVAFGDGFVEIEDAASRGGVAVGVASDEERRQGVDTWKRERLIAAGAHIIVPDFREQDLLVSRLFGEA